MLQQQFVHPFQRANTTPDGWQQRYFEDLVIDEKGCYGRHLRLAADSLINQNVGDIRRVRLRNLRSDFNSTWRTRSRETSSKRPI